MMQGGPSRVRFRLRISRDSGLRHHAHEDHVKRPHMSTHHDSTWHCNSLIVTLIWTVSVVSKHQSRHVLTSAHNKPGGKAQLNMDKLCTRGGTESNRTK